MKKCFLVFSFLFLSIYAFPQNFLEDVGGRPIRGKKVANVTGSPFLLDTFVESTIEMKNGVTYKNVPLNFDLLDQKVIAVGKDNVLFEIIDPINSFSIFTGNKTHLFRSGYPDTKSTDSNTFFEVLADGTITLLKRQWKVMWEEKTYNSATLEKSILDKNSYYIYDQAKKSLTSFKPQKKTVMSALVNNKKEMEDFIKKENINFSDDADLTKIFIYYNSL